MSHNFLFNAIFHKLLKAMDFDLSKEECAKGCPHCGGTLHRADYPRSPIGIPKEHREHYEDRYRGYPLIGQRIGYIRVSSFDQNPERQLEEIQVARAFTDKASGKDTHRPELERLLTFVRDGDTVVVHSMDRLARNLDDLRRIVQDLTKRGIRIEFVKEGLTFTGEDSPMANLMLSVMGAFAEFERSLLRERQREGIALAKKRGVYRGRKRSLNSEQISEMKRRIEAGEQKATVAREYGVSRETIYQYLKNA